MTSHPARAKSLPEAEYRYPDDWQWRLADRPCVSHCQPPPDRSGSQNEQPGGTLSSESNGDWPPPALATIADNDVGDHARGNCGQYIIVVHHAPLVTPRRLTQMVTAIIDPAITEPVVTRDPIATAPFAVPVVTSAIITVPVIIPLLTPVR